MIGAEQRHPVAAMHTQVGQRVREPRHPIVEFPIGHPLIPEDDGGRIRCLPRRAMGPGPDTLILHDHSSLMWSRSPYLSMI